MAIGIALEIASFFGEFDKRKFSNKVVSISSFFMRHLIDGDLAANNGGWQWAASTGCDAQPYFRIFNPFLQGEKFDSEGDYVRHYVPELKNMPAKYVHKPWTAPLSVQKQAGCIIGKDYPAPIVDHDKARARALAAFQALKDEA